MDTVTQELFDKINAEQDILKKAEIAYTLRFDREVSIKRIARAIQKHPSYVSHLLRLKKIPQIVLDGYYGKMISGTHLMMISRLDTEREIIELYEHVLKRNLTVSQTETEIRKLRYDVADTGTEIDVKALEALEKDLRYYLEAKVSLLQTRVRTKIVIEKRGTVEETKEFLEDIIRKLKHQPPALEQKNTVTVLE